MSLSTRAAILLVGTCLVSPLASAAPMQASGWYFGDALQDSDATAASANDPIAFTNFMDPQVGAQAVRNRTRTPAPTPTPTIDATPAPNNTGAGVIVGVVDTGIDLTHPEFAGRLVTGTCFGGTTVCSGTAAQGNDNNGHGTHVAGIIAAANNGVGNTGVAYGAKLMPVKVLDANGSGSYTAVAQGITWAANNGAKVISMSLGGSAASTTLLTPLQTAAPKAVIVAAAGNSGNIYAPGYPAAYATQAGVVGSMLIVGSVNASNVISTFSQTPGNGGCVATGGVTTCFKDVFVVAPGERILSTYKGGTYATMSGTSMATPYVSGVAARVLAASPFLTSKQVVSIILNSTTDLGAPGIDAVYGRGLVNLTRALQPLGVTTIATAGISTTDMTGTGEVGGSSISGALGSGLRNSIVARNAMFFDSYGRDYRTNLTSTIADGAVTLADFIAQSPFGTQFVSYAGDGYSVTGFVDTNEPNAVQTLGFTQDKTRDVTDMVVTARLTDNSTVSFGHNASLSGHVNALDLSTDRQFNGLFMQASALNSPYLGLSAGGNFMAGTLSTSETLSFSFGHGRTADTDENRYFTDVMADDQTLANLTQDVDHQRSAQNTVVGMNWNFASWGSAALTAAYTEEENGLLGSNEQGALAMTSTAATTSVGVSTRLDLGDRWTASASFNMGRTSATPMGTGLVQAYSDIESQAYGLAISKTGVFTDEDSVGFAVSRPLHITGGTARIHASTGVTEDRNIIYTDETVGLSSSTPETDFEAGYTAKLSDDTSLQVNAIYQQNVNGDASSDAVAGLVTLKTKW